LVGDRTQNYAELLKGILTIPQSGFYTLYLSSDDGSVLWIGNTKLIDNDGYHAAVEQPCRVDLKAGSYPIRIGFFQAGGDQSLGLQVEGPRVNKQSMPAAWLSH